MAWVTGACAAQPYVNGPEFARTISAAYDARFLNCYRRGLARDPHLKGSLTVLLTIAPDGHVASAALVRDGAGTHNMYHFVVTSVPADRAAARTQIEDPAVAQCVLAGFENVRFSPPHAPLKLASKVVFSLGPDCHNSAGKDGRAAAPGSLAPVQPAAHPGRMVLVPAGAFLMGRPNGKRAADEAPVHQIREHAFHMDATEVTVAQYAACVSAHACSRARRTVWWPGERKDQAAQSQYCNADRADRANYPENCVTWTMANTYCHWIGGHLPTEDQWQYAARGTDGRTYPWGNEPPGPKLLNACGPECNASHPMYAGSDGWAATAPVASFPAGRSPFGLYDMAGNVWEWTRDPLCRYSNDGKIEGCSAERVFRGGAWSDINPSFVRADARSAGAPCDRAADIGFRCVR